MPRTLALVLLLLTSGGTAAPALAQTPPVEASTHGSRTRTWSGSAPVGFPLALRNRTGDSLDLRVQLELPPGWGGLSSGEALALTSHEARLHVLGIGIPARAEAGLHEIPWSVTVEGTRVAGDTVAVRVPARPAVALEADERGSFLVAGREREVGFLLANEGNVSVTLRLDARWTGGPDPTPEPGVVDLEPGDAIPVRVSLETGGAGTEVGVSQQVVEVWAADENGSFEAVRASLPLEVIRASESAAPTSRHSFPMELTAHTVSAKPGRVWGQIQGEGPLRGGGSTRLHLLLRGPGSRGIGTVRSDRYRLGLDAPWLRLVVGDQFVRRTLLTEPGREAFGGSAEVRLGPFRAGGFDGRNRRGGPAFRTRGGFAGLRAGSRASVTVSRTERSGWREADLWGVDLDLRPGSLLQISAETGWQASAEAPARARRMEVSGQWIGGRYRVRHLRADSTYPGSHRGRHEDLAHLALPPLAGVRLEGTVRRERRQGAGGSVLSFERGATRTETLGVGWGRAMTVTVRRRHDEVGPSGEVQRARRRTGRVRLNGSLGAVRISPMAEYGQVRFEGSPRAEPVVDAGIEVAAPVGRGDRVSTSMGYESTSRRFDRSTRERWNARIDGRFGAGESLRLQVLTQASHVPGPRPRTDWLLDVEGTLELPRGHELEAKARIVRTLGAARDATTVSLGYTMPLDVPMGRNGSVGRVVGRVTDGDAGPGADAAGTGGLDSVVVRLGPAAVLTDAEGRFVFPEVEPGLHRVRLDASTLPARRVVLGAASRDVEVRGAGDRRVDFRLRRGGRIDGRVEQFEEALSLPGDSLARDEDPEGVGPEDRMRLVGPIERALVILEGPGGTRRRLTGTDGRFSLDGLEPGRWRIRLQERGLPQRHRVEPRSTTVELEAGSRDSVALRVVPTSRSVRMVGGGNVTLEADPDAEEDAEAGAEEDSVSGAGDGSGPTAVPRRYTVTHRDPSLMEVARRMYDGDGFLWPKIWAANREEIPDPDVVRSGQVLRIPERAPLTAEERRMLERYRQDREGGG